MGRFFKKAKTKKQKILFYVLFWIFFPLAILALILSLCYSTFDLGKNQAPDYQKSISLSVNYANNATALTSFQVTQKEALIAANNYVDNLKLQGFNAINVKPYIYEVNNAEQTQYFYKLLVTLPYQSASKFLSNFTTLSTYYAQSNLLNLDLIYPQTLKNSNDWVQYGVYNKTTGTYSPASIDQYYTAVPIAGLQPTQANVYSTNNLPNFVYNQFGTFKQQQATFLTLPLTKTVNLTSLITHKNSQILLWKNKAAFVTLCQDYYGLYWLDQQWNYLAKTLNSNHYSFWNTTTYNLINSLWSSVQNSNWGGFVQALYSVVGYYNRNLSNTTNQSNFNGMLTFNYNEINWNNIDNILFTQILQNNKFGNNLYTQYNSLISQYLIADISVTKNQSWSNIFSNIKNNQSQTFLYNVSSQLIPKPGQTVNSNALANLLANYKKTTNTPVYTPNIIINRTNANVYSNVNINPFNIWNSYSVLLNAYEKTQKTSITNNNVTQLVALNAVTLGNSKIKQAIPNLTLVLNNLQATNYTLNSKPILANAITHTNPWTSVLVSILIFILLVGIVVSVLYRFPGFVAWVLCTMTLGFNALVYSGLYLPTSHASMLGFMVLYIITLLGFVIFLQKALDFYRTGISYRYAFVKALRYFVTYLFDLYVMLFLFSLAFVYFTGLQLEVFGIIAAIYTSLGFLTNYLIGWFFYYLIDNFEVVNKYYVNLWDVKQNDKNYHDVNEVVQLNDPGHHYDLSGLESILIAKNTLALFSKTKQTKRTRLLLWIFSTLMFVLVLVISLSVSFSTVLLHYPTIFFSYDVTGIYLFHKILLVTLIALAFGAIYVLVRFGKALTYYLSGLIATYMVVGFFVFCHFIYSASSVVGLLGAIFLVNFINIYINIQIYHLFRFKQNLKWSDAIVMVYNAIAKQEWFYLVTFGVITLWLVINLIFNSYSLYVSDFMCFIPFLIVPATVWCCVIVVRLVYLIIKNQLFSFESKKTKKDYDEVFEENIEGINSFKANKHVFIYE